MKTINEILNTFFDKVETEKIISTEFAVPGDAVSSMWYVKVLVGVSGWFASLSFLAAAFVLLGSMRDSGVFLGILLCIAAVILDYFFHEKVFVRQFALSLCLAGQAAATIFFSESVHSVVSTYVFSIILSALIVIAYKYSVMRFIAVQVLVGSLVQLMQHLKWDLGISLLVIVLAVAVCALWLYESDFAAGSRAGIIRTCAYSLTFSLLSLPVLSTYDFFNWKSPNWWLATCGVALVFIYTHHRIFSSFNHAVTSAVFMAAAVLTAAFAAITVNSPGVITALFIMVLGFSRGNRIVSALAGLFLGAYIIMFYYNLTVSLLIKSYILMGSGALLLAAWAALIRLTGGSRR